MCFYFFILFFVTPFYRNCFTLIINFRSAFPVRRPDSILVDEVRTFFVAVGRPTATKKGCLQVKAVDFCQVCAILELNFVCEFLCRLDVES